VVEAGGDGGGARVAWTSGPWDFSTLTFLALLRQNSLWSNIV
jgi:hypothetical protein